MSDSSLLGKDVLLPQATQEESELPVERVTVKGRPLDQLPGSQRAVLVTIQTDSSAETRRNNVLQKQASLTPFADSCTVSGCFCFFLKQSGGRVREEGRERRAGKEPYHARQKKAKISERKKTQAILSTAWQGERRRLSLPREPAWAPCSCLGMMN